MQRNQTANSIGRDKMEKKNHNWVQKQSKKQTNDFRTEEITKAKEDFSTNRSNYSKLNLNWTKPNYAVKCNFFSAKIVNGQRTV